MGSSWGVQAVVGGFRKDQVVWLEGSEEEKAPGLYHSSQGEMLVQGGGT